MNKTNGFISQYIEWFISLDSSYVTVKTLPFSSSNKCQSISSTNFMFPIVKDNFCYFVSQLSSLQIEHWAKNSIPSNGTAKGLFAYLYGKLPCAKFFLEKKEN